MLGKLNHTPLKCTGQLRGFRLMLLLVRMGCGMRKLDWYARSWLVLSWLCELDMAACAGRCEARWFAQALIVRVMPSMAMVQTTFPHAAACASRLHAAALERCMPLQAANCG